MLDDAAIAQVMLAYDSLQAGAQALIAAANEAGGKDNIAVVLARVPGGAAPASKGWWPFKRS
jgi:PPM family protein phosphatase